jgi:polysaccharide biosynthesis protein PslH
MRIVVCAQDFPYPPRGGGRADVWRRVEAFVRLGHHVMLVNLFDPDGPRAPTHEGLAYVDQVVDVRYSFPIKRGGWRTLRQLLRIWRVPWHAATRMPDQDEERSIKRLTHEFDPDILWLEGPWFGELGLALHDELGVPIAYRSHNVEHHYLRRQASAATSWRQRISWRIACVGLKRYQIRLMSAARMVFDISLVDLELWRGLGVQNIRWLPPLSELALGEATADPRRTDVLFVGGLRTPNNVEGVRWLVRRILPHLVRARPEIVVAIVGSYPDAGLTAELADIASVQTHYDVPDVMAFHFGARVLVNPVSSGGGVQLKMIDMLMTDAPIVTRSQGVIGLPEDCVAQLDVIDDEEEFAATILRRLEEPAVDLSARAETRRWFGIEAVSEALESLHLE